MATDEATLSVQTVVALKAIYQTAEQYYGSRVKTGRQSSMFMKAEFIPPVWTKKYFARFAHISSSELAAKSKPAGLGALLMILLETRSLVLDVYDLKKGSGDTSAQILNHVSFLLDVMKKIEPLVVGTLEKDHLTHARAIIDEKKELPLMVLAPITMIKQRLFVREGLPGGGDHSELFKLCPEIQSLERELRMCLQRENDEFTCLLLATDSIGKCLMRVLENTALRRRYFTALKSTHDFCRMIAWAEMQKTYKCDLTTSHRWTGVSAFEDAVIHRRRLSLSRSSASAQMLSPPPLPSTPSQPPPPFSPSLTSPPVYYSQSPSSVLGPPPLSSPSVGPPSLPPSPSMGPPSLRSPLGGPPPLPRSPQRRAAPFVAFHMPSPAQPVEQQQQQQREKEEEEQQREKEEEEQPREEEQPLDEPVDEPVEELAQEFVEELVEEARGEGEEEPEG